MSTSSIEETVEKARRATDDRIESVRLLAEARQQLSDTRKEAERLVKDAENEDSKAYSAALSAGWSEQELKKIGLPQPDKKKPAKRRNTSRTTSATSTTTGENTNTSEDGSQNDHVASQEN